MGYIYSKMKLRLGLLSPPKIVAFSPITQSRACMALSVRWLLWLNVSVTLNHAACSLATKLYTTVFTTKSHRLEERKGRYVVSKAIPYLYTKPRWPKNDRRGFAEPVYNNEIRLFLCREEALKVIGPPASSVYRMMVASRSGLTEIILMGVPVAFSI